MLNRYGNLGRLTLPNARCSAKFVVAPLLTLPLINKRLAASGSEFESRRLGGSRVVALVKVEGGAPLIAANGCIFRPHSSILASFETTTSRLAVSKPRNST